MTFAKARFGGPFVFIGGPLRASKHHVNACQGQTVDTRRA